MFKIGPIPIWGDLVLAPLAGFSDRVYRRICREHGAALCYTEMALAEGVLHINRRTRQILDFDVDEVPRVAQLLGSDIDELAAAACELEARGAHVIDLNMGCSVYKVVCKGAGAALLTDPVNVGRIVAQLTRAVSVPVTAKIRLGWEAAKPNYLDIARVLEDNGAALIAVHGRARDQKYDVPANWDAIAAVKQTVHIPVIGNGDVHVFADVARMKAHTGCDAVMIGRAAIGNPWIFGGGDRRAVPMAARIEQVRRHLLAMLDFYGERDGVKKFRKHLLKYLREKSLKPLTQRLIRCEDAACVLALLETQGCKDAKASHAPFPPSGGASHAHLPPAGGD